MGVERVERIRAYLTRLDLTQDRPDDPVDVAPVGGEGRFSEIGDLKVLVEDLAEEDVPGGGLMAVRLPEQPGERSRCLGLIRACLPEEPFLAGYRVLTGIDLHPERAARQSLYVTLAGRGYGGRINRKQAAGPRTGPRGVSILFENCLLPGSPVTESNRRPSPYHLDALGSMAVVDADHRPKTVDGGPCEAMRLLHLIAASVTAKRAVHRKPEWHVHTILPALLNTPTSWPP